MEIKIIYKLVNESDYSTLILTPEEYFDFKHGDQFKIDDIPKYIFIEDYVKVEVSKICFVKLHIDDNLNYLVIESNFWDNGKSSSIKYLLYNNDENYIQEFLKVHKLNTQNDEEFEESIAFYRNEIGVLELRSHVILNIEGVVIKVLKDTNLREYEKLGVQTIF